MLGLVRSIRTADPDGLEGSKTLTGWRVTRRIIGLAHRGASGRLGRAGNLGFCGVIYAYFRQAFRRVQTHSNLEEANAHRVLTIVGR